MKEINTEINTDALPEKVWEILTDFGSSANWNPFIVSIVGKVIAGSVFTAALHPPESSQMTFTPRVLN